MLRAVVTGRRVAHLEVDAVISIPLEQPETSEDPKPSDEADQPLETERIGQLLKEALAPYKPGRAKIVLAIGRDLLKWQHLELPPCPPAELPDLVYMQAGFDTTRTGESIGFDFLPLTGDNQTANQTLAVSLTSENLNRLQEVCAAADLSPTRYVPLSLGWPAITRRATRGDEQPASIFVAPFAHEATIWATIGSELVLFRQVHLPAADNLGELSTTVAAELRRTAFALSHQHPEDKGVSAWIVGKRPDEVTQLTEMLGEQLEFEVQPMDFASDAALLTTKSGDEDSTSHILPLAGLAFDEAVGNAPPVDLLHPRQRPAPRTGQRTYALLAAVLFALIAYGGWLGYKELHAPVEKSDFNRAMLAKLAESEKELVADEQFAGAIREWQEESVNILTELQTLSEKIRPLALDAEEFNVEQDVMLKKLEIGGTRIDMDAALRTYSAVADLESRLREGTGRVQRDTAEENEDPPNYLWLISASVEFDAGEEENPKK